MHDVFLSHNSADKPAVEALAHRLRKAGIEPWLDTWNLIPGEPSQEALEQALEQSKTCAVFIGSSGIGPWQNEEIQAAISRRVRTEGFRVIPVLLPQAERGKRSKLPSFLLNNTWVEFRNSLEDEEKFHRLVAGIRGIAPGASSSTSIGNNECPYRGLQVFDKEHAPLFFGRRALTEWLLDAIRPKNDADNTGNRFLAMLGASGSGKSSLARAGLLASLERGELPDSQYWAQIILKPSAKPLESLAIAVCNEPEISKGKHPAELIEQFKQHDNQLHWQCRQALHGLPESRRVVILVDQFEEIFTLCDDERERQAFINNLLIAATDVTGQAIILLTLRADFYGKCAVYSQLAAALSDEQFLIEPMSEDDLRQAIEQPALRAGCELEAGLVEVLLAEVKDQSGSLPLLEYTLTRLWETRSSRVLRLEDYRAFGGLEGALNQRADEIYNGLSESEQVICQQIFSRLVQLGEDTEDTRRRATFDEFGNNEATEKVIQKLANVRLITTQQANKNNKAFAEVTHETLIRNWSQLKQWIDGNRESLKQERQITQANKDWEQSKQDDAWLLTGTRLKLAEEWLAQNPDKLSETETYFLQHSQLKHQAQEAAKKAEQEKQLQLEREKNELQAQQVKEQRKALIRTRWFSGMMAVLVAFLLIAAGWAIKSANEAEIASQEAKQSATIAQQKEAEANKNLLEANYNLAKVFEKEVLQRLPNDKVLQGKQEPDIDQLKQTVLYSLEAARQEKPENKQKLSAALFGRFSLLREQDLSTERKHIPALNISSIKALAYNSDGRVIVSGSDDHTVRLWNARTGGHLKTLKGHRGTIESVAYSPDGQFIASGSSDHTVRLWDARTGGHLKTLKGHLGAIRSVTYSPDSRFIASGSDDNTVRLWDASTGEHLETLSGHSKRVRSVAYSPDGKFIVTGSSDHLVRLWDASTGENLNTLQGHSKRVRSVAYSSDGQFIISGSDDKTVRLWDASTGENLNTLQGHRGTIGSVAYSPDGQFIVSGSDDRMVRLWDASTGESLKILQGHRGTIGSVAYSPDGQFIASGSSDGTVRLWGVRMGESLKILQGHRGTIRSVAYSPDGQFIVSGSSNGTVRLWDMSTGKSLKTLKGHRETVWSVVYSPDGKFIASGSSDHTVRLWDARTGEHLRTLQGDSSLVYTVAYSPDSKFIISGLSDGTMRLWNTSTGEHLKTLQGHSRSVLSAAYSSDGKFIASGSSDGTVRLWDTSTGEHLKTLQGDSSLVYAVAYSPDGQFIASGSDDNMVRLWDARTGEVLKTLQGHLGWVNSVTYSPDGQFIVSGSVDQTVRLWDAWTGESLKTLQGHSSDINSVAYSPDGKFIISGSDDKMVQLWDLTSPIHRLLFDFDAAEVADALGFVWQMGREGLEIVDKPHPPSLFPQMGYHITFTDKTRKYRPLLDMPRPDETKLGQVVRFLEERCAYKKPERYGCEPVKD